ncbi:MAG: hypothetical protein ACREA0_02930 [bacterium]
MSVLTNKKTAQGLSIILVAVLVCGGLTWSVFGQSERAEEVRPEGLPEPSVGPGGVHGQSSANAGQGPIQSLSQGMASKVGSAVVDKTIESFKFLDNAVETGFVTIPPDPIGAASKTRLVSVVNVMIETRTKEGVLVWRDSLRDFFAPLSPLTLTFDPKVIYDHYEGRFMVVTLEQVTGTMSIDAANVSRILLAVSKTGTPHSGTPADWYFHAINSKQVVSTFDVWADYPGFEADEEAVYITANMFTFVPFGLFGGVRLWIVDKGVATGGFYAGGPASVTVHNPYAAAGIATTTMPAQVFGAGGVGGPGSSIGTFLVSYSGLTFGGAGPEAAQVVRVNDPLGAAGGPFFAQQFVVVGNIEGPAFPALPDAPQAGTTRLIEVNDRRALDAVWRNNELWFTTTILPNSGPDIGQTTAHWFKLDTSAPSGVILLTDEGNIGGEDIALTTFTFFPAVAVNSSGDAMFGFSASAGTIFAGAFAAGRQASDPPGTVRASQTVHAGVDFYVRTFSMNPAARNRWGDYSGIAVDPVNDNFFWVFNEYADTRGTVIVGEDGRWGTAWGRVKIIGGGAP